MLPFAVFQFIPSANDEWFPTRYSPLRLLWWQSLYHQAPLYFSAQFSSDVSWSWSLVLKRKITPSSPREYATSLPNLFSTYPHLLLNHWCISDEIIDILLLIHISNTQTDSFPAITLSLILLILCRMTLGFWPRKEYIQSCSHSGKYGKVWESNFANFVDLSPFLHILC